MMHDVTTEIKELAHLTNSTVESLKDKFSLYGGDTLQAGNRATQATIARALYEAREAKQKRDAKVALDSKLASGAAIWRKVGSEWMVQVTGRTVNAGDILDVERKDGIVAQVIVKSIAATRPDGIYCKV